MIALRSGALRLLATTFVACLSFGAVQADENDANAAYDIGLWGDLPYSAEQETKGLPKLFADMNAARLKFSVHDGDLKQGSNSFCDDALYTRAKGWFNSLDSAAMFTPGDNDWTDCDRLRMAPSIRWNVCNMSVRFFSAPGTRWADIPSRRKCRLKSFALALTRTGAEVWSPVSKTVAGRSVA
jgi:hypothetical protein